MSDLVAGVLADPKVREALNNLRNINNTPWRSMEAYKESHDRADERVVSAVLTAAVPSEIPQSAWLIERGQPEGLPRPVWWSGDRDHQPQWTTDANKALRFDTQVEAEDFLAGRRGALVSETLGAGGRILGTALGDHAFGRATEHMWLPVPSEARLETAVNTDYRAPGDKILRALGLVRVVRYEPDPRSAP